MLTGTIISAAAATLFIAGGFGMFGAIIQYLYHIIKTNGNYNTLMMFQYALMGFFVGILSAELMGQFLGEVYTGVVLVSGFVFMKILDFLEASKIQDLLKKIIK